MHHQAFLQFQLLEFTEDLIITLPVHIDTTPLATYHQYDVILGLDAITELGIIIDGLHKTIHWDSNTIPFK